MEAQKFGAKIRELRQQAGMTQRELADKVGIDFTYLSKIESGVMPPPSEKVILRLAEALSTDKDELIILAGKIPSDIAQVLKNRKMLQRLRASRTRQMARSSDKKVGSGLIIKFKRLSRIAVAAALVLAVTASFWFAAPARALTIDVTDPSPKTLGSNISFDVTVTIEDTELIPIQSVNLDIYNSTYPATYYDRYTGLPLHTTAGYVSYVTTGTGGNASIRATADSKWGYGYGYRHAYGYEATQGYGYYYWGYGYGYGGYGYGYGGYGYGYAPTTITYNVIWPSSSNWPAGTYQIKVSINADGKTFIKTRSVTLSAAPAPPPPPAPPAPPAPTIDTNLFGIEGEFPIDDDGEILETITGTSEDGNLTVTLPEGTYATDEEGNPLDTLEVTVDDDPPDPPEDTSIIGLAYNFGPPGANFDPWLLLEWSYDPDELADGVDEEDLDIAFYDEEAGEWVVIDCVVHPEACVVDPVAGACCVVNPATNTITIHVEHFTTFAILAHTGPAVFVASDLSVSPTEVDIGETVTISVLVTNTGDLADSYEVTLKVDDVVVATEEVTLVGGVSQTVTFTTATDIAGVHVINVEGLATTFRVRTSATFELSGLVISPTEVKPGETVTISATVTNIGETEGSYTVTLKIDGVTEDTRMVTLAGGQSTTATFTVTQDLSGSYEVEVDGLTESFTVTKLINWWLIGGIIAAFIIIVVVISLAVRRRREA